MSEIIFAFSKKFWNASFFLFLALVLFSFTFFVSAVEEGSDLNFFQDTDQDGLSNEEEKAHGTDPESVDTDNDGYSDGVEIEGGYDPLKPAPGDRVLPDATNPVAPTVAGVADENNVTQKTSEAIMDIVKNASVGTGDDSEVKLENIDAALENALGGVNEELVLPEIDVSQIKVKKISKKLKGDRREEQARKDMLEYLTYIGYVVVNNSPVSIQKRDDFEKAAEKVSTESMSALMSGNMSYLNSLENQGEKFIEQVKDVEVPEPMLETHIRALQLASYAKELKKNVNQNQGDSLGQVAAYGGVQAFLLEAQSFAVDVQSKMAEYGIEGIPIDF